MSPRTRALSLTVHILTSVGWFGAVALFLVLAIAGIASDRPAIVTASYVAMDVAGWYVIVPLCLASALTGIVHALGTKWGLFRHYWVVIKLVLTLLATAVLLLHTKVIGAMAEIAARMPVLPGDHRGMRIQLAFDAAAAVVVLVFATVLAVYKPRGLTRYGRRTELAARLTSAS
jgi:hypothetical protein